MQINSNILDELYREAGEERVKKARNYVQNKRVKLKREEYEKYVLAKLKLDIHISLLFVFNTIYKYYS